MCQRSSESQQPAKHTKETLQTCSTRYRSEVGYRGSRDTVKSSLPTLVSCRFFGILPAGPTDMRQAVSQAPTLVSCASSPAHALSSAPSFWSEMCLFEKRPIMPHHLSQQRIQLGVHAYGLVGLVLGLWATVTGNKMVVKNTIVDRCIPTMVCMS